MNVTASPAPKSSILLEIEIPADRFDRAVRDATLARLQGAQESGMSTMRRNG